MTGFIFPASINSLRQINSSIFSLLPENLKKELPNRAEVNFVHPHNLGGFDFSVKKSPEGFNVKICRADSSKPNANDSAPDESGLPTDNSANEAYEWAPDVQASENTSV